MTERQERSPFSKPSPRGCPRSRLPSSSEVILCPSAHPTALAVCGPAGALVPVPLDLKTKLKHLGLSLKHKGAVIFAEQSTTIRKEVAAFGFHETTWMRAKSGLGWVSGQQTH